MLIVGPRLTSAPLPASSEPTTAPYCCSRLVSQVDAAATGAGSWVTQHCPSPTPCGPSSRLTAGMHNAGMAGMLPA